MAIESTDINLGTKAEDFDLPGTDGKNYSLDSFEDSKGLVVAFTCNHCPYAQAAWPLLIKLADEFRAKSISFVGINPNDESLYPEDSFEVMKEKVGQWGINFPYLRDKSQEVAKKYQAVCTPDVYVFDKNHSLYYHGRVNDNWKEPEKSDQRRTQRRVKLAFGGKSGTSRPKTLYGLLYQVEGPVKKQRKVIIAILIVLILVYFGFSLYVAHEMTKRMAPRLDVSPTVVSENYEDVQFKSTDELVLKGWLFKSDSDKLVIMVAGLLPNRIDTEYYAMWIAKDLVDQGYNVIMFDSRAHGKSEGQRKSYGWFEGNDILGAVVFAKDQGFKPQNIAILGDSTGAISTLMVADQLSEVGALIIDSAATNFKPIIIDRLWVEKKVPPFFSPAIFFFTDTVFGLKIGEVKPIDKLTLVPERKFLFLHGGLDETIPVEESKKLATSANPESKLVIFPDGKHIETFKSDPDLYRKEVLGFLSRELGQ